MNAPTKHSFSKFFLPTSIVVLILIAIYQSVRKQSLLLFLKEGILPYIFISFLTLLGIYFWNPEKFKITWGKFFSLSIAYNFIFNIIIQTYLFFQRA
ncbi:MAG TPA: hypothetical protein P5048_03410 [Chlamydiales bacterium]|nr:hypothetical protein [Chlamydiales bacterium]